MDTHNLLDQKQDINSLIKTPIMLKLIKNIFSVNSVIAENEELKKKLDDRQEAINKTNAYWKKIVRDLKKSKA